QPKPRPTSQASQSSEDPRHSHWVELVEGMAAYRDGNFDAAAKCLSNLETQDRADQSFLSMTALFLAMAQHQNGKPTAAVETFQRATNKIDDPHRSAAGWLDWLMCEIVRSEAEQLLLEKVTR
ncbi:MAG: hypothetical protein KDB27_04670, partial [Planctomycetales bacterium]|nr:hypothetical protein [Planctomycetales bacterium]